MSHNALPSSVQPRSLPYHKPPLLDPLAYQFYQHGLIILSEAHIPFLVGGAHAYACYTGIVRHTKDFDIFVHGCDYKRSLAVLAQAGYHTDCTFPHWLGKAFCGDYFIDLIFGSGNGECVVDDEWFTYAVPSTVLETPVHLCPPEEIIWQKAFIAERERYDGADIAHLLRACALGLSWSRLLRRFGSHWRLLLSHLVLFGFVYPNERSHVPEWVIHDLLSRLQRELQEEPPTQFLCQGTLLSRQQYLIDVLQWGYEDARLSPRGVLTQADIDHWTAGIDK
jgi:hypothetical protein